MSNKTAKTLFIHSPFASEYAGLYQELVSGIASYEQLGNRLIQLAEQAHAFRQFDKVKELGQILSNISIKHYQAIGHYFLAVAANSMGNGDQAKARELFELVVDTAPQRYKAKALLSLAAISAHKGNYDSELFYFVEGLKASTSLATTLYAQQGIAVIKAKEGFHRSSLRDLENLYPLMRFTTPRNYFDYMNSLAVELNEAGRKEEARNVSRVVLASPFAFAYPEWQETANELKEPNRSFVAFKYILRKARPMPEHKHEAKHESKKQPASIVAFPPLKEAPPPQKPERLSPQEINELKTSEKRELILAALRTGKYTPFDYDRFMVMVGLVDAGPADKVLDLEDEETLRDIVIIWAHQLEPEELAGVLSALRDCEDRLRQRDIIDKMIRIAFEETLLCGTTEDAWRFRVERRLPEK